MVTDLPPFVTPSQLADYVQGKISVSDPWVGDALDGASAAVRRYCGWHVWPVVTADSVILDGPGGRELDLPSRYVTAVQSITQDDTLVDGSTYTWSRLGYVRLKSGWWSCEYQSVVAVFDHGYASVPDIERVVLAMVARELSSPSGATREQAGQVSVSYALTAPGVSGGLSALQSEYAILDSYRIAGA